MLPPDTGYTLMIPSVSGIVSAGILLVVDSSLGHFKKDKLLAREKQF